MEQQRKRASVPLLESTSSIGTASMAQTVGNIIVSVVGTGVLGLPFAFRTAGWLAGSIVVLVVGLSSYYCMFLLIQCRRKLASEEESTEMKAYGDLGYKCMGRTGGYLTEFLILIAQVGGSVAYLVFIGQNLSSIFKSHGLTMGSSIFLLVPIEIGLSWIGSLSALAPFSIFADCCNVLAMAIVVKDDIQQLVGSEFSFRDRAAITFNMGGLSYAGGMAVFCFGGFGMTLALESSMKDKSTFPKLLAKTFTGITLMYVLFGFSGYMAYGDQTQDIVILNLPHDWWAVAVQVGLCLGLIFTFPIMIHPIKEIVEGNLDKSKWFQNLLCNSDYSTRIRKFAMYMSRAILVISLALLASYVPGFGIFASLVGSTLCALISFVLPTTFHLILFGGSLHFWQRALDFCILSCGLLFAAYGTYNTLVGI
ncbi:hypothetical protein I3760_09G024600 [Carya illinoinensis]|nr:hypothetical protein I3760_09G024600 [Carya illinoinensis]